ncbi:AidA/PixA family protein [Serratia sp. K-E0102]
MASIIYYRPNGGDQKLLGYFYWDPTITISN